MRKILFWLHLVTGVTMGAAVLVMCVTGALLTYQRQMQYWADTRSYREAPAAGAARLSAQELVSRVEAAANGNATTVTFRSDPSHPAAVAIGPKTLYANPYSGAIYGEPTGAGWRTFFTSVTNWHRYLAMSGDSRTTGKGLNDAANLGFLFIVLSGLYLWWPKNLKWATVRNVTWFRRGLPGKARDFNWHNTIGFWSAIPLAIVVYSGVVISYPWASNGVYRLMGEQPPPPAAGRAAEGGGRGAGAPRAEGASGRTEHARTEVKASNIDAMFKTIEDQNPGWQILSLRLPTGSNSVPATMTIDFGDGGQPHLRGTATLNAATGTIETAAPFSSLTPGRRLRNVLRFSHTGEALGLTGQTIAGLASAGGAVLVYTGIALALRRFLAWRRRPAITSKSVAA